MRIRQFQSLRFPCESRAKPLASTPSKAAADSVATEVAGLVSNFISTKPAKRELELAQTTLNFAAAADLLLVLQRTNRRSSLTRTTTCWPSSKAWTRSVAAHNASKTIDRAVQDGKGLVTKGQLLTLLTTVGGMT